jgi:hypothetical protein
VVYNGEVIKNIYERGFYLDVGIYMEYNVGIGVVHSRIDCAACIEVVLIRNVQNGNSRIEIAEVIERFEHSPIDDDDFTNRKGQPGWKRLFQKGAALHAAGDYGYSHTAVSVHVGLLCN